MFVGATNPCPCGYLGDSEHPCQDSIADITKYRSRLSGPIADRIDMRISVGRIDRDGISATVESPDVAFTRSLVNTTRAIALARQGKANTELSIQETEALPADPESIKVLCTAIKRLGLSLRVYHRTLRVSQTIADLENAQKISPEHILEALSFRES
jgi:magnesium chelatase family protein